MQHKSRRGSGVYSPLGQAVVVVATIFITITHRHDSTVSIYLLAALTKSGEITTRVSL